MKRATFWLDTTKDGRWGIECDDPALTFDGHYVAVADGTDKSRKNLEQIASTLNTYLPPRRDAT